MHDGLRQQHISSSPSFKASLRPTAFSTTMPSFKDLGIPASNSYVQVKLFDVAAPPVKIPAAFFLSPVLSGHENISLPIYASLIEHDLTKKRVMFDLGARKDIDNCAPAISDMTKNGTINILVEKDITEQLTEGGVPLETISAVIWR